MTQFFKNLKQYADYSGRTMEARDHFKNGASPKSLMSRGNVSIVMKKNALLLIFFMSVFSLYGQYNYYGNQQQMQQQAQQWAEQFTRQYQQQQQQQQQQAQEWAKQFTQQWQQQHQQQQQQAQQWAQSFTEKFIEIGAGSQKRLKNYSEAFETFKKFAEKGSAASMYELAEMYELGLGIARNPQTARYWYKKAEDNGLSLAYQGVYGIDNNYYEKYTSQQLYEWAITLENDYIEQQYHVLRHAAFRGNTNAARKLVSLAGKNYGLKKYDDIEAEMGYWCALAGDKKSYENYLQIATNKATMRGNQATQSMIDNINDFGSSDRSSSSNSSSNSSRSSGSCTLCNGTGQIFKGYNSDYTGNSVQSWCNICRANKYPHYHGKCPSCK